MGRSLVGGVVLAALVAASACGDDGRPDRTIGFVRTTLIVPESQDALLSVLEDAGWTAGEDLTILNADPDAVAADAEEATAIVSEMVDDGVDVLIALSTTAAIGALGATDDVPIVTLSTDPVATGLVADPRAPEGNVTGIAFKVPGDRTIDVARQLVGGDPVIGVLFPSDDPGGMPLAEEIIEAGDALGITVVESSWTGDDEAGPAVDRLVEADVDAIVVVSSPTSVRAFPVIEERTRAAGIPVVANTNVCEFAVIVLAPESLPAYRQVGRQVVRLLDGRDVEEVPVEAPGSFRLLARSGLAESIGVTIPDELLAQADEVED